MVKCIVEDKKCVENKIYLVVEIGGAWEDAYSTIVYATADEAFAQQVCEEHHDKRSSTIEDASKVMDKYRDIDLDDMTEEQQQEYDTATESYCDEYVYTKVEELVLDEFVLKCI